MTTSLQKSLARYKMEACERAALNREHANMYRSLADLTNNTSDTIQIFMHLYAVSDFNQQRLVKQKMATIFRADFHRALTSYNADSSQGIFGGEDHVMRTLEKTKKAENACQEQSADNQESQEGGRQVWEE